MSLSELSTYGARSQYLPDMMNFRGTWSAVETYYQNDVAVEGNDSYILLTLSSLNQQPTTAPPGVWLSLTGVTAGAQVLSLTPGTDSLSLSGGGGTVDLGTISSIQALNLKTAEMSHLLGTDETTFGPALPVVSATQGVNVHGKLEVTMGPAQVSFFEGGQLDLSGCAIASDANITTTADMACNELSYVTLNPPIVIPPATAPGGVSTSVQYNNGGAFAGDSKLVYAAGTETLSTTNLATATIAAPISLTVTTPSLLVNTLPAASTSNVMYYDNGTGAVSYGAAPGGGTVVDISSAPFYNLPVTPDTVWVDAATEKMYSYQTPYLDVPVARTLPTFGGATVDVANEAQLDAALAAAVAGQTIRLTADILAVATTKTISAGIKLTSDTGTRVLSCAAQTTTVTVNTPAATNVLITGIIIENSNPGSTAAAVQVAPALNDSTYFDSATIRTNEFGIVNNGARIQVTNCAFEFVGTPDSHRYIGLYRNNGQTIIANNTFAGNGAVTPNSQCIFMTGVAAPFIGGSLVVMNNTSVTNPVQRLMIAENPFTGTNFNFWFINNTLQTNSGFVIIYNATSLDGITSITAYGNTETAAPGSSGGKGLIGLDSAAAFTIPAPTAAPVCYFSSNSMVSTLAPSWVDWSYEQDDGIAYNSALATATGTKKYSPGWSAAPISKDITYNTATSTMTVPNVYIPGKLTVDGLIDPTGMIFTPQATNPGAGLATLYVDSANNSLRYDLGGLRVNGAVTSTLSGPTTTANVVYYNTATGLMTYGTAPGGGFTSQLARYSMAGTQTIPSSISEAGRNGTTLLFNTNSYNFITGLTYNGAGTWTNSSGGPMSIQASCVVWVAIAPGTSPGPYGFELYFNLGGQQATDNQWFPVPNYASSESVNNITRLTFSCVATGIVPNGGTITVSARTTFSNAGAGNCEINGNFGSSQVNFIRLA